MRREFISKDEILTKLREAGLEKISQVNQMPLKTDGRRSISDEQR